MKLLIISDIHANMEALNAVLGVEHNAVVCLGDLVDYGPAPAECIECIQHAKIPTIMGNHDNAVASKVDCGCGYVYKHLSVATRGYTWDRLDAAQIDYLKNLPQHLKMSLGRVKMYFAHGSPRSMYEYIKPETSDLEIAQMTQDVNADFIVVGHSHIPFVRVVNSVTIINPGSVGQPRDGDTRASCAVFDTKTKIVEIIRCDYDVGSVCTQIQEKMPNAAELIRILKQGH